MHYLFLILLPNIVYGQNVGGALPPSTFDSVLGSLNREIFNPIITFLFALAIGYFLYGVVVFLSNADNEEKRTTGKSHILWGVIGISIMLGVWGILSIVLNTLHIEDIDPKNSKVKLGDFILNNNSTLGDTSGSGGGTGGSGGGTSGGTGDSGGGGSTVFYLLEGEKNGEKTSNTYSTLEECQGPAGRKYYISLGYTITKDCVFTRLSG